ncbi:MAG: HEAT repeat domain-containing protein [Candidatus Sumerlaeota bacterium]|nr:HEAT repeat domain-containing protein [Candidatus Sumerlaeota bacterium]
MNLMPGGDADRLNQRQFSVFSFRFSVFGFQFSVFGFQFSVLVCLFAAVCSAAETVGPNDAPKDILKSDTALLAAHGIADDEVSIIRFLTEGFGPEKDLAAPPAEPVVRCQLLLSAMMICAVRVYRDSATAIEWLAQGKFGPGINRMLNYDVREQSDSIRAKTLETMTATLRYNAVNALGLMGLSENTPFLMRTFELEREVSERIHAALALASTGSAAPLKFLVQQMDPDYPRAAYQAAEALRLITGEGFYLTAKSSSARREMVATAAKKWLKENGSRFQPDPQAIRKRRFEPPRAAAQAPPRLFEDWLARASDPDNLSGPYNNLDAFRWITAKGIASLEPLRAIVLDDMQDTNVHITAIRAYTVIVKLNMTLPPSSEILEPLRKAGKSADPDVSAAAKSSYQELKNTKSAPAMKR